MKKIKFHFHGSKSLVSRIIQWRTNSAFSHVSVEVGGYYYQAYFQSEFYRTIDPDDDITETVDLEVDDDTYATIEKMLRSRLGIPYDYSSVIGWLLNRHRQSNKKWYCSEMALEVLSKIIGKTLHFQKLVTPNEVRVAVHYFIYGREYQQKT